MNHPTAAPRIMLSYRRDDTPHAVDRIAERLENRFGPSSLFLDILDIEAGAEWKKTLARTVEHCDVMLVLIGPDWLRLDEEGGRSALEDRDDPVRMEIRAALRRRIAVIPVLIDDAEPPSRGSVPADCARLLDFNRDPALPDFRSL